MFLRRHCDMEREQHNYATKQRLPGQSLMGAPVTKCFYKWTVDLRSEKLRELTRRTEKRFFEAMFKFCVHPSVNGYCKTAFDLLSDRTRKLSSGNRPQQSLARPAVNFEIMRNSECERE